jgi:hypothetical protein
LTATINKSIKQRRVSMATRHTDIAQRPTGPVDHAISLFFFFFSFHFDSPASSFHAPWRREKESRHPATDNSLSLSNEIEIKSSFAYSSEKNSPTIALTNRHVKVV